VVVDGLIRKARGTSLLTPVHHGRPAAYADDARLHAALTHLRANKPVAWVDNPPYRPFWAITRHADIMAIERANDLFLSEPLPLLATAEAEDVLKEQMAAGMGTAR
jgi:cytochrome P450